MGKWKKSYIENSGGRMGKVEKPDTGTSSFIEARFSGALKDVLELNEAYAGTRKVTLEKGLCNCLNGSWPSSLSSVEIPSSPQ